MEELGFNPITEEEQQPKVRPTFLTVLCVLSWVSAVWTTVSSITALANKQSNIEELESSMDQIEVSGGEQMPSFFEAFINGSQELISDSVANFTFINSSQVVLYLAQIFAVFLMFNLKKKGFWLYSFIQVTLLVLPITYMTMNSIMVVGLMFGGLLALAFIIMYAVNLKHMD